MLGLTACSPTDSAAEGAAGSESALDSYKRQTASQLAEQLADDADRAALLAALRARGSVAVADQPMLATSVGAIQPPAGSGAVPELWLHDPDPKADMTQLLVAYAPSSNESTWTSIPAYTLDGTRVSLDPAHPPANPVIVVETHGKLAMRKDIDELNHQLEAAGLQRPTPAPTASARAAGTGRWTIKLDAIRLNNDQEPWILGDAEVYAVTSGVVGNNLPQVHVVEMPYLTSDGTTYYPHQIILDWTDFDYQVANIQLFEHDESISYQALVIALVDAIGAIGNLAGYPVVSAVTTIANAVIKAMPSSWFSNDDDYIDSFYTVEKSRDYSAYAGVGGNASVTLTRFYVAPN